MNSELLISIVNQVIYVPIRHHYKCRAIITYVENPLQINSFYAKQSQFPKKSNERYLCINKELRKKDTWWNGKNKAKQSQTKPIQSQFHAKYAQNKANTNPIKANFKPVSLPMGSFCFSFFSAPAIIRLLKTIIFQPLLKIRSL